VSGLFLMRNAFYLVAQSHKVVRGLALRPCRKWQPVPDSVRDDRGDPKDLAVADEERSAGRHPDVGRRISPGAWPAVLIFTCSQPPGAFQLDTGVPKVQMRPVAPRESP
jgi:hypothetical protein